MLPPERGGRHHSHQPSDSRWLEWREHQQAPGECLHHKHSLLGAAQDAQGPLDLHQTTKESGVHLQESADGRDQRKVIW